MKKAATHLLRFIHWHSATNLERVQTPRWRQVRAEELRRCAARFEDAK